MDYEKKYKKALKVAKDIRNGEATYIPNGTPVIEAIFPELKESEESEDEKIRQFLIHEVKETSDEIMSYRNISKKDVLAWLEKQREQETLCDKCRKEHPSHSCQDITALGRCAVEYEHKSANKDKSKFKIQEGKWYVCTQTFVLRGKIVIIKGQTYQAEKDNVIKGEDGCLFIDRHDGKASDYFKLWTIQDAKDGDVLVNWNNTVFIFKDIEDETVKFHIAYNEKWNTIKTPSTKLSHLGLLEPQFEFNLATKEQCDKLEKAISDAGYTFDFDKKELKNTEKKNSWSEEDEKLINRIEGWLDTLCDYLKDSSSECVADVKDIIGRLKSLKDRVQHQPRQ